MGTNYYWHEKPCSACGRGDVRHIGKSSAGWHFALHVYPEENIKSLYDWLNLLLFQEPLIKDQYGKIISLTEMIEIIVSRQFLDKPRNYSFYEENDCEPGFNNLLRHKINDRCIGHGEGPWDYLIGDFS